MAVECPGGFVTVIKANHRNVHVRTVQDPRAIAFRKEDIAGLLDAFQRVAVRPTPDALRGQQAGTTATALPDMFAGLLKPVAAEIGFRADAFAPEREQLVHVLVAELPPHEFAAEEWWVADDEVDLGPLGHDRVVGVR